MTILVVYRLLVVKATKMAVISGHRLLAAAGFAGQRVSQLQQTFFPHQLLALLSSLTYKRSFVLSSTKPLILHDEPRKNQLACTTRYIST